MWPIVLKSQPPTIAPTIPNTLSVTTPDPDLFTILLAIKPEISPRTIHATNDIETSQAPLPRQPINSRLFYERTFHLSSK